MSVVSTALAGQAIFEDVTDAIGMDAVGSTVAAGCAGELVAAQVRGVVVSLEQQRIAFRPVKPQESIMTAKSESLGGQT